MKCEMCGKETDFLEAIMFDREGMDYWISFPVHEHENGVYLDLDKNWTGYGESDEEMAESIRCPHCHKFPFICKEIQEYEIIREVMFTSGR